MAEPIVHNLHPNDIALQDTSSYNEWFTAIKRLTEKTSAATQSGDTTSADMYRQATEGLVSTMEQDLSSDEEIVNIGPMLEMWDVEGKESFGTFAADMLDNERNEALELLYSSGGGNLNLSKEQSTEFIADIKTKEDAYKSADANEREWTTLRDQNKNKMAGLWQRYEDLSAADPDNDFLGESRAVWWGWATPDNSIQQEIAEAGVKYRELSAKNQSLAHRAMHTGFGLPQVTDITEKQYTKALEALDNLQGE